MLKSSIAQPNQLTRGALVRIPPHSFGCRFRTDIPQARTLIDGMFGTINGKIENGVPQYFVELHELMPEDFRSSFKSVLVGKDTTLEHLEVDSPADLAPVALEYISRMGELVRNLSAGIGNGSLAIADLVRGQIEPTVSRIMPLMAQAGYKVVEQTHVVTKTTKQIHIVQDVDAARARIAENLAPEEGRVYILGTVKDKTDTVEVKDIASLEQALYAPVAVSSEGHRQDEPVAELTPFMRAMLGMDPIEVETINGAPPVAAERDDEVFDPRDVLATGTDDQPLAADEPADPEAGMFVG